LVALECAVVDFHIAFININSSALQVVACPPPGIGAEITRNFFEQPWNHLHNNQQRCSECAVMDLHIGTMRINSSALEVACPPGHRGKFRKIMLIIIHSLTSLAMLLSKMLV
jgi:hypothetical protein